MEGLFVLGCTLRVPVGGNCVDGGSAGSLASTTAAHCPQVPARAESVTATFPGHRLPGSTLWRWTVKAVVREKEIPGLRFTRCAFIPSATACAVAGLVPKLPGPSSSAPRCLCWCSRCTPALPTRDWCVCTGR